MVPPLVPLLLLLLLPQAFGCRLSEFACQNGRCVPSGRFCDGNDDCGDLSDEPTACTNCNRTFYAEANVKSPLRMSTPHQRPLPFVCSMTFVAAGGEYGDLVQITFLSFQIGALEMENDSRPACPKGYLQIVEPPAVTGALLSQQTRGFSQLLSALKQPPTERLSSLFDSTAGAHPEFGRLCGDMIGKSATFYTEGNNVTLRVVVPSGAALHPLSFSVHLTYKYLPSATHPRGIGDPASAPLNPARQPQPQHLLPTGGTDAHVHYYYGTRLTNTYCDRVLVNCDRKRCSLRSPNFPGFYLRNITCHYWVRQESVPHGRHAHIVLTQSNEYKISLYTGRSSPLSYPHVALTEECHSDVIRVFDGPSTDSPLLVEFCGAGTLAEVVSSSPEILVQLYSAPSQVMHNSYAEIEVGVRFADALDYRATSGRCDFAVDGSVRRTGLLHSPRHTLPRNTTCRFQLRGRRPQDRVWLYFLSYFADDRHPWSRRETCEAGRLEIYEPPAPSPGTKRRRRDSAARLVTGRRRLDEDDADSAAEWQRGRNDDSDGAPSFRFCEKTLPKVCARAADRPDHVPVRPCAVPDESYLSRGPGLVIRHNVYTAAAELSAAWSSSFALRYEFVDMRQRGLSDGGGSLHPCGQLFDGAIQPVGSVDSPRNVFLFGRGGSPNVSCLYEFVGAPGERIVLTFTDIRLRSPNCEHRYDPRVQRHACRALDGAPDRPDAVLRVVERTSANVESPLGCFCDLESLDPRRPLVVESVTHHVLVSFEVTSMGSSDDFEDFGFEAVYEFVPISLCEASIRKENGSSQGEVIFLVPPAVEGRATPLRCRWLLEAAPRKYLYMRFRGTDVGDECPTGNKIIVYPSLPVAPLSVVCLGGGGAIAASIAGAESASATGNAPRDGQVDVFSDHWYDESSDPRLLRDHVYIEVLASRAETVRFEWIEVTKAASATPPSASAGVVQHCRYECPELNACLSAELWCDGRRHCPSGYDEAPAHCERFPTPYAVAAGASAAFSLLLALLALVALRRCRRTVEFKESRPVPTDDFPMDSPQV